MFDSALSRARVVLFGPGGSSNAGPGTALDPNGGTNTAADRRPDMAMVGSPNIWPAQYVQPFGEWKGVAPNVGGDRQMQFIPPLSLFNDASRWVDRKYFVRPLPAQGNPDSNPLMMAQYFTPPPINMNQLAAGQLNLQLQLGNITNQAAQLTSQASMYYGG